MVLAVAPCGHTPPRPDDAAVPGPMSMSDGGAGHAVETAGAEAARAETAGAETAGAETAGAAPPPAGPAALPAVGSRAAGCPAGPALPAGGGRTYHVCDCAPGADSGCRPGDDAADG